MAVKVKKLTIERLAKAAPAINQLYAQQEKKKRRETMNQQFERVLTDLKRVLRDLTDERNNVALVLKDLDREREERKKKIKAGLARAKKRGVKLGGARRTSNVDAKTVVALRKRGMTQQEIAEILNVSQPLVSKILASGRKP